MSCLCRPLREHSCVFLGSYCIPNPVQRPAPPYFHCEHIPFVCCCFPYNFFLSSVSVLFLGLLGIEHTDTIKTVRNWMAQCWRQFDAWRIEFAWGRISHQTRRKKKFPFNSKRNNQKNIYIFNCYGHRPWNSLAFRCCGGCMEDWRSRHTIWNTKFR